MKEEERQVTDEEFNAAVYKAAADKADREAILEKYGLSEKDVKRYKKFCAGETPKKWAKHRERILKAFASMPGVDRDGIIL